MMGNRALEDDKLGSPVASARPATWPMVGKVRVAASRHRVVLGSFGIAVVAVVAWQSMVRTEPTSVAQRAALDALSAPVRQLEITVLGVHDAVAAPSAPPEPPVAVARPVAAPASVAPSPATVAAPSRAITAARSAPARAQSNSGAKASPLPVAAFNSTAIQEPRGEVAPAKQQPKPDGPPVEINPYVYK